MGSVSAMTSIPGAGRLPQRAGAGLMLESATWRANQRRCGIDGTKESAGLGGGRG